MLETDEICGGRAAGTRVPGVRQRGGSRLLPQTWLVSFMHYDLGFFDHETGRVECADNPFKANVLRMSE